MPSHPFVVFCDQVCKSIRWPPAQRLAWEELTAHLEDHAAALEEQGVPPEEAATRAVEAMGDPKGDRPTAGSLPRPIYPQAVPILCLLCLCHVPFRLLYRCAESVRPLPQ